MQIYLMRPLAPVVLRTGKPFGATEGGDTLPFPYPSVNAGALRAAYGDAKGWELGAKKADLLGASVAPPMLVRTPTVVPPSASNSAVLVPCPANLSIGTKGEVSLAEPHLTAAADSDVPGGVVRVERVAKKGEKFAPGPQFVALEHVKSWLSGAENAWTGPVSAWGTTHLPVDVRAHHRRDYDRGAPVEKILFQSAGLDLAAQKSADDGWSSTDYQFLSGFSESIPASYARFGGDARPAYIAGAEALRPLLAPPTGLQSALERSDGVFLLLISPAVFLNGWEPGWAACGIPPGFEAQLGARLRLRLRAFVGDRWLPLARWDIEARRAKPLKRMVPAGSVYWFEFEADSDRAAAAELWMRSICDEEQDRRDGFGWVLPGAWKRKGTQ